MKKKIFTMMVFCFCSILFADISRQDFFVLVEGKKIHLGDSFGKIIEIKGNTNYKVHSYTNITLREYLYEGMVVSTSHSELKDEKNRIYGIYFTSSTYSIVEDITIGDCRFDVMID